jgi:autotransporter family porin
VQFTGGNNSILNNGTFNLRHFADTNGDGVRDTVRVAIADLGNGQNNSFTNNGTLALVQVTGATMLDSTGQYLPLGQASNAMALNGPLQGHLIGVQTFTNTGIIDLQSNPAAGDVLVITGGRQAGLAINPLIAGPGPGIFITGGLLKLDTVLNQGGPTASQSDVLVVDGTSVGSGATGILIRNAGGTGRLTVGDGILVVQVLDSARSADGAFKLGNRELRAGDFDYRLFHGGVNGSNPGDWFLRDEIVVPPRPPVVPPEPGLPTNPPPRPLPPGVFPIIGPEIADLRRRATARPANGAYNPRHAQRPGRRHLQAR